MNTHGGKRKGAGRKKSGIVKYQVLIRREQAALLKRWGGGDRSAGLRWLIDVAAPLIAKAIRRHAGDN